MKHFQMFTHFYAASFLIKTYFDENDFLSYLENEICIHKTVSFTENKDFCIERRLCNNFKTANAITLSKSI